MSETGTIRARRLPDGTLVLTSADGSPRPADEPTDWARVDALTDDEIEANAAGDPDNPPMTPEDLARMRPVPSPKAIRQRLRLSQEAFADRFGVSLDTLRDWEQGTSTPDTAARTLLRVIETNPEAVLEALAR